MKLKEEATFRSIGFIFGLISSDGSKGLSKCIFLIVSVNVCFSSHIESVFMGNSDSCESVYSFIGI